MQHVCTHEAQVLALTADDWLPQSDQHLFVPMRIRYLRHWSPEALVGCGTLEDKPPHENHVKISPGLCKQAAHSALIPEPLAEAMRAMVRHPHFVCAQNHEKINEVGPRGSVWAHVHPIRRQNRTKKLLQTLPAPKTPPEKF